MLKKIFKIIIFIIILTNFNCYSYKKYAKSNVSMGSDLTIIIFSDNKNKADNILNNCFDLSDKFEKEFSCKIKDSIISKLNIIKDMIIENNDALELIIEAKNIAEITNGAFDPTLYKLIDLWGIERGDKKIPESKEIERTLEKIGYQNLIIKDKRVILKNDISIDLGGIAAGKIIEKLANYLKKEGVKDFLINASGDLVVEGKFQGIRDWKIGISNPYNKSNLLGEITLTNSSIVTSGDYEKYFLGDDGKRYHHILDGKTGYPSNNNLHSVTVITKNSVKCDAISTALFVMGETEGLKFLEKNKEIEAIFISNDENKCIVSCSPGIKKIKNEDGFWDFIYCTRL